MFFSPLCLLLSLCEVAGTLGGEPGELTGLGEPELPLEPDKSYSGGHVFMQERGTGTLEPGTSVWKVTCSDSPCQCACYFATMLVMNIFYFQKKTHQCE